MLYLSNSLKSFCFSIGGTHNLDSVSTGGGEYVSIGHEDS